MVHSVVLACVLRATTKIGRQLFFRKKVQPNEFAHPWKKILRAPMAEYTVCLQN